MFKWLDDKHRLVLVNDETFQEERSFRLTPFNFFALVGSVVVVISLFTTLLMIYTPAGRIVPERSSQHIRKQINEMYLLVDSLEETVHKRDLFISKVKDLVFEKFEYEDDVEKKQEGKTTQDVPVPEKSDELKELMASVDNEVELGNLIDNTLLGETNVDKMIFIPPLRGIVSDTFAPNRAHYGTDVIAPKGSVIKSTQNGTVIVATWSADTGHMIGIQHENNVISFYKHNSSLLKKAGDVVNAGEGIAIIGNTGEQTNGPHLHFELWFSGQPINPQRYISFNN